MQRVVRPIERAGYGRVHGSAPAAGQRIRIPTTTDWATTATNGQATSTALARTRKSKSLKTAALRLRRDRRKPGVQYGQDVRMLHLMPDVRGDQRAEQAADRKPDDRPRPVRRSA